MEEQKKEQEIPEKKENTQSLPARSMMLLIIAGAYLIYTGYTLCKNVLEGQEGAGWGFFVAGVAFVIIGAGMLFQGIKSYHARTKEKGPAEETAQIEQSEQNDGEAVKQEEE